MMSMNKRLSMLLAAAALAACGQSASPHGSGGTGAPGSATATPGEVVARVNGAPITEADVRLKLQNDNHEAAAAPASERRKAVLDSLISREILAQKAGSLGLDQDPRYQEGLRKLEAQLVAYRRQELSELLLRRESEKRATPSDDEARAYFEENGKRIRTQVHVLQILRRSEAAITEARSAIERGKSFDEVALGMFPGLPEGQRPWDLGYLSFSKVPEPWRETVYDMKPGEMSGVLRGPNERFWLVKLVDTRDDPNATFESVKEAVLTDMKGSRQQRVREDLERELRAGARVELTAP